MPETLIRQRATTAQFCRASTARSRREDRFENLKGAFTLKVSGGQRLRRRRGLRVDEVFASGATFTACAKALREAEVREVDVRVLARAVLAVEV